jgi:TatA/E family protein of Tat protein translocase
MIPFALVGPLGWSELLIIFFIILIIFGPRKLPEVAEAMGKSIQKFKRASKDARKEIETGLDDSDNEKNEKKDAE